MTAVAVLATAVAAPASEQASGQPIDASVPDQPATLEDLMRTMASTPGVVAHFTETKHLELLDDPLTTAGVLYFIPPDRMVRQTTSPARSSLVIDGDRLVFEDDSGGDQIDLAANPIARVFVENFIVLFNGDLVELRRRYEPTFTVDGDAWSLRLVPRRAPLSRLIESIVMRGDAGGMRSMALRESGGDSTETVFTALDAAHRFSASEIETLFGAEPTTP